MESRTEFFKLVEYKTEYTFKNEDIDKVFNRVHPIKRGGLIGVISRGFKVYDYKSKTNIELKSMWAGGDKEEDLIYYEKLYNYPELLCKQKRLFLQDRPPVYRVTTSTKSEPMTYNNFSLPMTFLGFEFNEGEIVSFRDPNIKMPQWAMVDGKHTEVFGPLDVCEVYKPMKEALDIILYIVRNENLKELFNLHKDYIKI